MKDSILEKFFIGYISFAILGMLIITYWSTNITYNHLVETTASQLYNYATVAPKILQTIANIQFQILLILNHM